MQRLQAFKFELMPNGAQARDMRRFAGARRFVFNKALDLQQRTYEAEKKQLSFAQLCKLTLPLKTVSLVEWFNSSKEKRK